ITEENKEKLKSSNINSNLDTDYEIGRRYFLGDKENVQKLESILSPIFKNSHKFYQDYHHTGRNESLYLRIAQLYEHLENNEQAKENYLKAVKVAPYDENILTNFAKFLLRKLKSPQEALEYAIKAHNIQKNHSDINLLVAEICISLNDYEKARIHLKNIDTSAPGYFEVSTLLKAEIALEENKLVEADEYLKSLSGQIQNYSNIIKNLQLRLNQSTQSSVKSQD
ncbi:MAG: hypothetical protein AAF960_13520, partial [Bacteroidota bacterium]